MPDFEADLGFSLRGRLVKSLTAQLNAGYVKYRPIDADGSRLR